MKDSTNIIIHVNENMDKQRKETFSNHVQSICGVLSVDIQDNQPHFVIVAFNQGKTKAIDIVSSIKEFGTQAHLISWL